MAKLLMYKDILLVVWDQNLHRAHKTSDRWFLGTRLCNNPDTTQSHSSRGDKSSTGSLHCLLICDELQTRTRTMSDSVAEYSCQSCNE